jgi:C1A family cysteine protease
MEERKYPVGGCLPEKKDIRDYKLKAGVISAADLPEEFTFDVEASIKNQGTVNSCVAHAMSSILESYTEDDLSTNFIYGTQKMLYGHEGEGMYLRDACATALKYGDMKYEDCPGNIEVPNCYESAEATLKVPEKKEAAYYYRINRYFTCNSPAEIKYAIYNYGPVLAALNWSYSFYVDDEGILRTDDEKPEYCGGHAVMVIGWTKDGFLCQNSWGESWGFNGKFILPYAMSFTEARGIEDYDNRLDEEDDPIKEPSFVATLKVVYMIINKILNFFKGRGRIK